MPKVTVDTDRILAGAILLFATIGIIFTVLLGAYIISKGMASPPQPVPVTTIVPTPSPAATPVPTQSYPDVLTFTILSTTSSSGHFQAYTTTGQTLYFADYSTWNSLWPQDTYIGNVIGMEGLAYKISTVTLLNVPYSGSECNSWLSPNYCDKYYRYRTNRVQVTYTPGYRIIDSGVLYQR